MKEFRAYPPEKLVDIFAMKNRICECIIKARPPGDNNFKLSHRTKQQRV